MMLQKKTKNNTSQIYLYAKDPCRAKYQLLINKREIIRLKNLNDSKTFVEQSGDMNDIFKNIEEYNPKNPKKLAKYWLYLMIWLLILPNNKKT